MSSPRVSNPWRVFPLEMKNIFIVPLIFISFLSTAQDNLEPVDTERLFEVNYESPLTIDLGDEDEADEPVELKKKKRKKNVFYGIKTKKGFARSGFGDDQIIELFYYLKEFQEPDPYVRNTYWYDFKKRKIVNSRNINKKYAGILHGPYAKMMGDQLIEEGIFHKGTKHGRWMRFNKYDILQEKKKWYKGWPKESKVAHYEDQEARKMREIIPIHYGEKDGEYYAFHENGQIAVIGEYKFDKKVGLWREYYVQRNRRKREVQYSEDPFEKESVSFISKEWDKGGNVIYDREKEIKTCQ